MEAVQNPPLMPDEETEQYAAFSAALHEIIVKLNAGMLALLPLTNQQTTTTSSVFEANRVTFLCFCVVILFYFLLRAYEAKYIRIRFGFVTRLVGHVSHLFGGLATLVLVYIICPIFALLLLLLWFLCLSTFVYCLCTQLIFPT